MGQILIYKNGRRKKKSGDDPPKRDRPFEREIDIEKCPVKPLGEWQGTCFYMSRSGELRQLKHREHRELEIKGLFGGELEWLIDNFNK